MPNTVEVVGTMTEWRRISLEHDPKARSWQVNLQNIPGNKTHHYMLLLDGKPAQDKTATASRCPWALRKNFTPSPLRGPRVFMLFAQTK